MNALVHIDAVDTLFVYEWRLEQERALRKAKGFGMKDKQVIEFVNGCEYPGTDNYKIHLLTRQSSDYPAYELYTDVLRRGIFHQTGKQLRLVVDKNRKVEAVELQ